MEIVIHFLLSTSGFLDEISRLRFTSSINEYRKSDTLQEGQKYEVKELRNYRQMNDTINRSSPRQDHQGSSQDRP